MRHHRNRWLATSVLVSAVAAGSAAWAADEPGDAVAEVIVTGTHIVRPDLEVASPVSVVGQDEIQMRQAVSAEGLLRDLPSVRPNLGPAVNNGSDGSASVDLRGIGSNRTLVLIDGRRVVPFGLDGVTDLNVVPLAMVERVDVVTGGASSTYGADAVAGVVNFVTRRNFTGLDLSASYGLSDKGDAKQYRADLTMGANLEDGRGNAVISMGYQKRASVLLTERDISKFPISIANGQFSASTVALQTIFTLPRNALLGVGPSDFGAVVDTATGTLRPAVAADTYNSFEDTYLQQPLTRYNLYAAGRYELTDHIEAYASGMFVRNQARIQQAATGTFANTYNLPLSNAYLPAGVRSQLCSSIGLNAAQCALAAAATTPTSPNYRELPVIAQRRFVEFGPRGQPISSDVYQMQFGLRGKLFSNLSYDLSAQYGATEQDQARENWGSSSKLQQALRSYRNAAGTAVCSDTANGCVPLNLFGAPGTITADQLAFIDLDAMIARRVTQKGLNGVISGDLFGLTSPFTDSPVAFSVGGEYRKLTARAQPDAASQVQGEVLGTGARTPPDYGAYSVKEAFAELIAPLVSDQPFIRRLQAEAGLRLSDYTTTGRSTTWKAGLTYEPVQGVKLRGMYQVAVRSPNISELFQSPVTALGNLVVDPCQGSVLPSAAANPGLAALCTATGAPTGTIGFIPAPTAGQINNATSGNRSLDVERAHTYTLGLVLTPSFLPNASLTVDYFNIKVKDAITKPASGDILNGCYSASLNPTYAYNGFCELIRRNPLNGSLNGGAETPGVILAGSNLGVIETAGIDIGLSYRADLADFGLPDNAGKVSWSLNGSWLDYYHFQATPNAINRDCTGYYSNNCGSPRPEFKWNSRLTYSRGIFDVSLMWNHLGSVKLEPYQATATLPLSTPQTGGPLASTVLPAFSRIKAFDYFDLAVRAKVNDETELLFTVDNLFDKAPPLVGNGVAGGTYNAANTFPTLYDVIGRSFTVGIHLRY